MILRTLTTRIVKIHVICSIRPKRSNIIYNNSFWFLCCFAEFSFSTKDSIYLISVGVERFNGALEIFRLMTKMAVMSIYMYVKIHNYFSSVQ